MHGENDRNILASTAVAENRVYLIGIASSTRIGLVFLNQAVLIRGFLADNFLICSECGFIRVWIFVFTYLLCLQVQPHSAYCDGDAVAVGICFP